MVRVSVGTSDDTHPAPQSKGGEMQALCSRGDSFGVERQATSNSEASASSQIARPVGNESWAPKPLHAGQLPVPDPASLICWSSRRQIPAS